MDDTLFAAWTVVSAINRVAKSAAVVDLEMDCCMAVLPLSVILCGIVVTEDNLVDSLFFVRSLPD